MAKRIERVLTNNPGIGVARHVNARREEAERFAEKEGREELISSILSPEQRIPITTARQAATIPGDFGNLFSPCNLNLA